MALERGQTILLQDYNDVKALIDGFFADPTVNVNYDWRDTLPQLHEPIRIESFYSIVTAAELGEMMVNPGCQAHDASYNASYYTGNLSTNYTADYATHCASNLNSNRTSQCGALNSSWKSAQYGTRHSSWNGAKRSGG